MNATSRMPTYAELSSTTIEVLRANRRRRFAGPDELFQAFAEASDVFQVSFGYRFTVRGCWTNQYLHMDAPEGGVSLYSDCRDDDIPTEVALDLLHAALHLMEKCAAEGDDEVFTAQSAFIFTNDDKMAAWNGTKCAEDSC